MKREARGEVIVFSGPGKGKTTAAVGIACRGIAQGEDDFTESVGTVQEALAMAHNRWLHECDLLVLDDITPHLDRGSIDIAQVLALIADRPPNTSIILTGQSVPEAIMKRADIVSDFLQIKQPSNAGIRSRRGIKYNETRLLI